MRILLVATALLSFSVAPFAVEHVRAPAPQGDPKPSLRATIQLISQGYCESYDYKGRDVHSGIADFRLHIQIFNEGKEALIVSRKYATVNSPVLRFVSPEGSPGDVAYEDSTDDRLYDVHYPKDLKDYQIIRPGESFELDGTTWFEVRGRSDQNQPAVPRPGSYFLAVDLSFWDGPPEAAAELRKRWRSHGYLFDGYVESDSVPVKLDPPSDMAVCPQ